MNPMDLGCKHKMVLVSYKWNNEDNSVVFTYMCKLCDKIEKRIVYNFNGVQDLLNASEVYNKYNL